MRSGKGVPGCIGADSPRAKLHSVRALENGQQSAAVSEQRCHTLARSWLLIPGARAWRHSGRSQSLAVGS